MPRIDMKMSRRMAGPARYLWLLAMLALALVAFAACQPSEPQAPAEPEAAAATAAPAEEATAPPAEEPTAQPEEEATAQPEEEATAMPVEESMGDPDNGAYIFNAAVGCGCHFNRDLGALAGGNKFEGTFGVVYSRNLTPDPATGLAGLTDAEIVDSIRIGKRAGGGNLAPAMPRYATMSDKDALDLAAYLRSQDPVENAVPDPELTGEIADFMPQQAPPAEAPTEGAARGQYLASLVRCGRCHTPTNEDGTPNNDLFLAGAPFRDTVAPNLTPDEATGMGAWSEQEIADFLATGVYADGLESHAGMKSQVDNSTGKLTDADRLAIAAFLKSLPPVDNLPEPNQ